MFKLNLVCMTMKQHSSAQKVNSYKSNNTSSSLLILTSAQKPEDVIIIIQFK